MASEKRTLVIGDCHGHIDRLEALLKQEGIIEDCPDSGVVRRNFDVEVVQLGDLGHFGTDTQANDRRIWQEGTQWLDVILWGNHDRAVVDRGHIFGGYGQAFPETLEAVKAAQASGQLRLAHCAHGFLLTHAGLHAVYKHNKAPHQGAEEIAAWLNAREEEGSEDPDFRGIRDSISYTRGGRATHGGILWRDASESLYDAVRQVFGHTKGHKIRRYESKGIGDSYCVDLGDPYNGTLAGIWLPDETIVEVKLEEDAASRALREEAEERAREFWNDPRELWRNLIV